jgi:hypothetical protein
MFNQAAGRVDGIFHNVALAPNQALTLPHPSCLSLVVEAPLEESTAGKLELELRKRGGTSLGVVRTAQLQFKSPGGDCPKMARTVQDVANVRVPSFGDYRLVILVDGQELGGVPFRIVPAGPVSVGTVTPPRPDPDAPDFELRWGHVLGGFDRNEFRAGIICDIVEWFQVTKGTRTPGLNLKECVLALCIEAAHSLGPSHTLTVRIPAIQAPTGEQHSQPLNLGPFGELRLGALTWVSLTGLGLPPGRHVFEVGVDGSPLGNLDLHVIHPPK